jgi:excisionase family DNA binding protein
MNERLLSKLQAANFLGISALKLDQLRKAGDIAFIKIGTRVLFRIEDLQNFIERNLHSCNLDKPISQVEAMEVQ